MLSLSGFNFKVASIGTLQFLMSLVSVTVNIDRHQTDNCKKTA